jgi:hypothetical protein
MIIVQCAKDRELSNPSHHVIAVDKEEMIWYCKYEEAIFW